MAATKPTIVLIQGTFQTPAFYDPLRTALQALGVPVVLPALPTTIPSPDQGTKDVSDDAASVQSAIDQLVAAGTTVVIAMHSYGSMVGAALNLQHLSLAARKAQSARGGVSSLLFFGAMAMPEGISFFQMSGGKVPDEVDMQEDGTFTWKPEVVRECLLDGLPAGQREVWAARTVPQSQKIHHFAIAEVSYKRVPCVFIVFQQDKVVLPAYAEMAAQGLGAPVVKLDVGHGAHLAQPELLAATIVEVLEKHGE